MKDTIQKTPSPLLYTVREVGEILRIQRAQVYALIQSEDLEGFKVGNSWRIRRESIEKMVGPITVSDEPSNR